MKARIKKTGEIVEVICYGGSPLSRSDALDYVNYIDSQGVEHTEPNHLNYYWDFEPIYWDFEPMETATNEHWQDVRERAAIAAMQGTITILSSSDRTAFRDIVVDGFRGDKHTYPHEIADFAVACADALIEELNKK